MKPRDLALFLALLAVAAAMVIVPRMIAAAPIPPDTNGLPMAYAQKIFYFHVPSAWCGFLSVFVCAAGSVVHLAKRSRRAEAIAVAAAELVVVFGLITLVTGPLWARKQWGVFWVWKDVRLVTELILWVIFLGYLFVRAYGGPGSSRLASGLALFGAVDVPIVYLAVFFWRTQHPKGTVVAKSDPAVLLPMFISLGVFTVVYVVLLTLRYRLERHRQLLDDAHLAADEAGLLET